MPSKKGIKKKKKKLLKNEERDRETEREGKKFSL
jgi:hypothetical protein